MGACGCRGQSRLTEQEPPEAVQDHGRRGGASIKGGVNIKHLSIHKFYDVEGKLGQGSYGEVYRATQRASGKECAVKCLKTRFHSQAQRWSREVEIMRSLDHPNIVKLVESFQDKKNMQLVVELCKGGQLLSGLMAKGEPFSEQKMAMVLQQILRGTLYLHSCSIAHRDLKPENLLFSSDASVQDNAVKIIDFGLARRFATGELLKTMVGSPVYVAPEVLNGKGYDSQCDIWSVGATAFVLACGHTPFKGKTERSVLDKVARGTPLFLPVHWRQVTAKAKAFVSTLLTKNAERRPTAAKALGDAWLTATAGPEAPSLPCGFVENLRRFKSQDMFSRAVRHVVAGLLDDPEVCALRSAFVALDADGNGLLSPRELKEGLRLSGLSLSEQELVEILEGMDVNGNGAIEYTEFLAAAVDRSKCQGEGMCQYAFDVFDWDGDGQISLQDLKNVVRHRRLSDEVSAECQAIVESLPTDKGRSLCLSDFKAILDM
jgi:calcium-dependent protein kinase